MSQTATTVLLYALLFSSVTLLIAYCNLRIRHRMAKAEIKRLRDRIETITGRAWDDLVARIEP